MTTKPSTAASRRRAAAVTAARAVPEQEPTQVDGRDVEGFDVPGVTVFSPEANAVEPLFATLFRPTAVQMVSLARLGTALNAGGTGEGLGPKVILLADELLSSLFVHQHEWNAFERATIRGEMTDEQYVDFLREVLTRFLPAPAAGTTGPAPTRRKAARR